MRNRPAHQRATSKAARHPAGSRINDNPYWIVSEQPRRPDRQWPVTPDRWQRIDVGKVARRRLYGDGAGFRAVTTDRTERREATERDQQDHPPRQPAATGVAERRRRVRRAGSGPAVVHRRPGQRARGGRRARDPVARSRLLGHARQCSRCHRGRRPDHRDPHRAGPGAGRGARSSRGARSGRGLRARAETAGPPWRRSVGECELESRSLPGVERGCHLHPLQQTAPWRRHRGLSWLAMRWGARSAARHSPPRR